MAAHTLLQATTTPPFSIGGNKKMIVFQAQARSPSPKLKGLRASSHNAGPNITFRDNVDNFTHRRDVTLGLSGALVALTTMAVDNKKSAVAARRPPPPPAEEKEKKDPNISGVMAKVLASKKRKDAMKETMAKQREKGKPIVKAAE